MIKYSCPGSYKKIVYALENIYKQKYTRGSKRSRANIIISAILIVTNPMPRLPTKVPNIEAGLFKKSQVESLKSNLLYLVFFQKITILQKS